MGRDHCGTRHIGKAADFNPLSPCGERRELMAKYGLSQSISIHSPRVGRDLFKEFIQAMCAISIHSPRVGRDSRLGLLLLPFANFNPLSPCGERHRRPGPNAGRIKISIHSPRVGRDILHRSVRCRHRHFNPLSPCGERQDETPEAYDDGEISIHSPRVGRDLESA